MELFKKIFLFLGVGFLVTSCDSLLDNPYDSKANPDSWKPNSVDYYVVSPTICKLSWIPENEHIDGFKIDKYSSGEWVSEYASVSKNDREWYDNDFTYQSDAPVKYRIYAVAGSNESAKLEVLVNPLSPEVRIDSVIEVNESELHFYVSIVSENKAAILEKGICWATTENPVTGTINNNEEGSGFGVFDSNVSDLPDSSYYFRAYAKNASGTSYSLNYISYQDRPKVITSQISNITSTKAYCGGNVINEGSSVVSTKGVCWSTNPNPTNNNIYHRTIDGNGDGEFVSEITGLSPITTYYVRAYATNEFGTSYGQEVSFTTIDFPNCGVITDIRDGNIYQTVLIGGQCWMAENLKYLPSVVGPATESQTEPCYYVYDYNDINVNEAKATANYFSYGTLYNWPAAMAGSESSTLNPSGVQGVCPAGWHLPSGAEWEELINFLGEANLAGGKLKENGTGHWMSPNTGATNETGFTAFPGGYRNGNGSFGSIGSTGYWWSATEGNETNAQLRGMFYNSSSANRIYYLKELGFSVRCVRD